MGGPAVKVRLTKSTLKPAAALASKFACKRASALLKGGQRPIILTA
jgi:hypothetical protein